jgi:hypothetical protein
MPEIVQFLDEARAELFLIVEFYAMVMGNLAYFSFMVFR